MLISQKKCLKVSENWSAWKSKNFIYILSLKRTLLMYMAVQIPEKEIEEVRKIFVKLD